MSRLRSRITSTPSVALSPRFTKNNVGRVPSKNFVARGTSHAGQGGGGVMLLFAGKGGGNAPRHHMLSRTFCALQNIGVREFLRKNIIREATAQGTISNHVGKHRLHMLHSFPFAQTIPYHYNIFCFFCQECAAPL